MVRMSLNCYRWSASFKYWLGSLAQAATLSFAAARQIKRQDMKVDVTESEEHSVNKTYIHVWRLKKGLKTLVGAEEEKRREEDINPRRAVYLYDSPT